MLDILLEPTCFQKKDSRSGFPPVHKSSPHTQGVFILAGGPLVQLNHLVLVLVHTTSAPDRSVLSWSCKGQGGKEEEGEFPKPEDSHPVLCEQGFGCGGTRWGRFRACLKVKPAGTARGFTTQNRHKTGPTDHCL